MDATLNLLRQIILNVPNYIFWKDKSLIYKGCNKNFALSFGFNSVDDIIGKTDLEMPWATTSSSVYQEEDYLILNTGKPILDKIVSMVIPGKGDRFISVSKVPLYDDHGSIDGVLGIYIDITSIKESERSLSIAKDKAEAASKAKTEFLANMSHDIRTPLAGVIGMSEMLELNLENPEHKEEAHLLSQSGNQLLAMLNEILDDIRAGNSSEVALQEETFDVHHCIQSLIELESPTTTSNHLGLVCDIDSAVPDYIISDRKKIHHILLNLLGNAVKFTKSGRITIEVKCLDRTKSHAHLQFGVADTGIGIPEKLQKKVFERFFRVDPAYKGRYEGYGLGLNIVQSYVNLLGGHITLTSKEGVGTTFHFDLQCKIGKKEDVIQRNVHKCVETPASIAQKVSTTPLAQNITSTVSTHKYAPYLLLVEDNAIALKVLEFIVSKAGYRFTSAGDGEHALELAKVEKFDLIISDIGLPGISGTKLTQSIREWENVHNKPSIPIIGLTGHARETAKPECMACGMNDVFTKPIDLKILQTIVNQVVLKTLPGSEHTQPTITGKLGPDLPDTEAELFELDAFPIFDPKDGLKMLSSLPMLFDTLKDYLSDRIQIDIHSMEQAYANKNWIEVERIAHKMKGGVIFIGTSRLRYACQYFERYFKAGHRAQLDKLYHQIITINTQTKITVQAWLQKYAGK